MRVFNTEKQYIERTVYKTAYFVKRWEVVFAEICNTDVNHLVNGINIMTEGNGG